jgi:hypothetical protein
MIVGTFQRDGEFFVITADGRVHRLRYDPVTRSFVIEYVSSIGFGR